MAGSNPVSASIAFSHISSIAGFFTSYNRELKNGYSSIEGNIPAVLLLVDFQWNVENNFESECYVWSAPNMVHL